MSCEQSVSSEDKWIVRVQCSGHLDGWIRDYWHPLSIQYDPDGSTSLKMELSDSAAFYGLINQCRDLGLEIICLHAYRQRN